MASSDGCAIVCWLIIGEARMLPGVGKLQRSAVSRAHRMLENGSTLSRLAALDGIFGWAAPRQTLVGTAVCFCKRNGCFSPAAMAACGSGTVKRSAAPKAAQ